MLVVQLIENPREISLVTIRLECDLHIRPPVFWENRNPLELQQTSDEEAWALNPTAVLRQLILSVELFRQQRHQSSDHEIGGILCQRSFFSCRLLNRFYMLA